MDGERNNGARSLLKRTDEIATVSIGDVRGGFEDGQPLKAAVSSAPVGEQGERVYLNMWKERGALKVFVKDGRITRTEVFDPKGQLFASVFQNAERYRVYSPERIQYPMKRIGWAPGARVL